MTDYESIFAQLERMSPVEEFGRASYQQSGVMLRHGQYLYLLKHGEDTETISHINDPVALQEQSRIVAAFRTLYGITGLSEQDFMSAQGDIEVEQLLRYVEIPPHSHEFVECAYVLKGNCLHRVGESEVIQKEGDFIFVPVHTEHYLVPVEDAICVTIKIRAEAFAKLPIPQLPNFIYSLCFSCGSDSLLAGMILFLYQQQNCTLSYRNALMESALTCLITYILQQYPHTMQPLYRISIKNRQMLSIINHMYENFRTVTLHELARQFHYNESYLSRMFKEQTGSSFSAMIRDFKLRKAAELLKDTNWKLSQICEEIGYGDTRQFIRSFKEVFGITPEQFRRNK